MKHPKPATKKRKSSNFQTDTFRTQFRPLVHTKLPFVQYLGIFLGALGGIVVSPRAPES